VFVATLVRSAFGFGEALIAVPLLALFIPMRVAAPLAVLVSVTIAAVILAQDWRHIHLRSASWLVISTLFGIPLGLVLLTRSPENLIKAVLGGLILLFALFFLAGKAQFRLHHDSRRWLLTCGFLAGILGGAYGMNGPPLVIYGSPAQLDSAALPRHIAGVFPARQFAWDVRIPECGAVDADRDT
jgi:hypothetical protein